MCGIVGVLDPRDGRGEGELDGLLSAMRDCLVHRGPDDHGTWTDAAAGVGLGFRRLAVIDLSHDGNQPMPSPSDRYVAVYNGEIYDFRRHRADLESSGVVFRSHSDTEVLLGLIDRWGVAGALERVTGMFAIAVWDRQEKRLSLARDRFGEKPLYWARCGRGIAFASELKALRAHPDFDARIDRGALTGYFQQGYIDGTRSIYASAQRVAPGTIVSFSAGATEPAVERYWSAADVATRAIAGRPSSRAFDERSAVDRLDALLADTVALRLESDVPLGTFLSGGIDSSAIAAFAAKRSSSRLRTFTMGFDDPRFDESTAAAAVARHLGTDHTEVTVTGADALAVVPSLADIYDEPFADSSQIPTHLMCRLARRDVTVALSGDGGDELFLGYDRYRWAARAWQLARTVPGPGRRAAARVLDHVRDDSWVGRRALGRRPLAQVARRAAGLAGAQTPAQLYSRLNAIWPDPTALTGASRHAPAAVGAGSLPPFPEGAALADTLVYLPDDILVKVDRAAMAVSLETRAPLLDQRVFEFAWGLPTTARLHGPTGKHVLRQVVYRHVPQALVDRPKQGFGVPLGPWLRGPLRDWAAELLDPVRLKREGYLDPTPITAVWVDHQSGAADHGHRLWAVLMFEAWLDRWGTTPNG